MVRNRLAWMRWSMTFLCACSAAVPNLPVAPPAPNVLVVRPGGYQPVLLTQEEFQKGMRMLFSRGPLPGAPPAGSPRFILTSTGGLDGSEARDLALRFAFAEALRDAATAVGSMTPDQVRAILGVALVGTIVAVLSPDPVTKYLFIVTGANLIAFIGVDFFKNVVKGYLAMTEELASARDLAQVQAAGERYGRRLGPTVARIVLMIATYGVAKVAGLFPGHAASLPGGSRAAALAEAQGFRIPAAEGARSVSLAADGSVALQLGTGAAMAAHGTNPAYEEALAGGKHAGTLQNYARRPRKEIERAVAGYERQVALHAEKLRNPAAFAEDWSTMTPQQQAGLLNKWRLDMARNQELADVLRGFLESAR